MKKNDKIELEITGFLHDGTGVGHHGGLAVFVPNTAAGDKILAHILSVKKSFAYGKVERIITPSAARTEPVCPVAGKCGGCAFSHINYEEELRIKKARVLDNLRRIGGLDIAVSDVFPSPQTENYRNKALYPIGAENGEPVAGFYAPRSHRIVPHETCLLQNSAADLARRIFLDFMRENKIPAYDEISGHGLVRHLFVRTSSSGEVCVMPVINGKSLPKAELLIDKLKKDLPGLSCLMLNFNTEKGNTVVGKKTELLYGAPYIEDTLCGVTFRISPLAFYQVNRAQCENLYAKVAKFAALSGRETVADLYCGAGTIGLSLAKNAKKVFGIEINPEAVENAKENAELNNIENAEFFCGDAKTYFAEAAEKGESPDIVVVDPPRAGCDAALLRDIAKAAPKKIIYVSCDPATLARDLKILSELNYTADRAFLFDMFPRTAHVETVVALAKN